MTSTLHGMDDDRRAAVRALLVQHATPTTSPAAATTPSNSSSPHTPPRRPLRSLPRGAFLPAMGLTAVVVAIATTTVILRPTPAFAVSGSNGEEVTVKVNRLEGAEALKNALRARGIAADITYLPSNTTCRPGRYAATDTPGLSLTVGAESFEVVIPAGAVSKGQTFVLSAAVTRIKDGVRAIVELDIAQGAIAPCTAIDAP